MLERYNESLEICDEILNLYPNNDYRPTKYHADLMAYYNLSISKKHKINFKLFENSSRLVIRLFINV